jgi:UDP-N-acetylmuramoyl-tripeptide--D-alanyl-D-alanine ligase
MPVRRGRARAPCGAAHWLLAAAQTIGAILWRTLLIRTTFIAITGSFGKTTAKDCLGAMLCLTDPTLTTHSSDNGWRGICQTILRARPWHRYVVIEVGATVRYALSILVRPDIAVMLSLDSVRDKTWIRRALGRRGTAVANGDDTNVRIIADLLRCRIVTFGMGVECEVRGWGALAHWPHPLALHVSTPKECRLLYTRLVGDHWVPAVLGAVAAAHTCGIGLDQASKALKEVYPVPSSLQPAPLPSGAVMLRDETNGSLRSFEAALSAVRQATARRKVLVISDCSDFPASPDDRQRYYAQRAAEIFDAVVFIGEWSHLGIKHVLLAGMDPDHVHGFVSLEAVSQFLRHDLRDGDLVLLRGRATDHLSRIYHAQFGPIECWKQSCTRSYICDTCSELGAAVTIEPSIQDVELLQLPSWRQYQVR